MMISVSIQGDPLAALDADYQNRYSKINTAIQKAGIKCAASAKRNAPVGTPESTHIKGYIGGRLRASIQYEPGVMRADITTNVNYSKFVEFGTRYMAARPFMMPAFMEAGAWLTYELSGI